MYSITRTWSAARHQPDLRQISVTFRRDTMVDVADPDVPSGVLTRSQRECVDAAAAGDLTRLKSAHENGCHGGMRVQQRLKEATWNV